MLGHILRRKNALVVFSTDHWDVMRQVAGVLGSPEPTRRSISAVV